MLVGGLAYSALVVAVGTPARPEPRSAAAPGIVQALPQITVVESQGVSGIDESPVTGESVPRTKGPGEEVFAGSINTEAALRLRVTKAAEDNTIARIIRLVEEAQEARAPTERFIDRFSRWYMPAIVGLAILVAIVPPLMLGEPWGTWVYRALALLLIGCPCALVISVPASIASSLSAGARRGLLMKGGAVIEAAARTEVVTFDKTGTLTVGRPKVTDVVALDGDEAALLGLAAGV
jgi:Cd2+/Zn2+-exporting ATPase